MAIPLGVLAFPENDGFSLVRKSRSWARAGLPRTLEEKVSGKPRAIYCMAIGTGENWFCSWQDSQGGYWWAENLGNYPQLKEYLYSPTRFGEVTAHTFHVSLGPNGSFYVNNEGGGQYRRRLPGGLDREISRRRTSDGRWDGDPREVHLGVDGSFVLVGKKGDLFWDLKGHYGVLDGVLQKSHCGVQSIALSPFDERWHVVFSDGSWRCHAPGRNLDPYWNGA